ncbi:MAG TPA: helix-turn-helix transcriptional regulator [Thermoanaerobaculia bacterium]|nr:helix-turn-helix transcriptional regulator [Thermoanaerobaculia bacterium]
MRIRPEVFRRLCRARRALTEIPEDPPPVEGVAREARISPFHFIRQFDAVFGQTPHQLRIEARLARARRLLALGELRSPTCACAAGQPRVGDSAPAAGVNASHARTGCGG